MEYGIFESVEFLNESRTKNSLDLTEKKDIPEEFKEVAKRIAQFLIDNENSKFDRVTPEQDSYSQALKFSLNSNKNYMQTIENADNSRIFILQFYPDFPNAMFHAITGIVTIKHDKDVLKFEDELFNSVGFDRGKAIKNGKYGYYYLKNTKDKSGNDCIFVGYVSVAQGPYGNGLVYLYCVKNNNRNLNIISDN